MKSTLDELLARVNVLDVVSQYVKLRKAGKDYLGLCPFHKEKTPSFTVSVEKQMFYCFGCHEGGNVINFVEKYENLSFQEALEHLGRQYGIEIIKKAGGAARSNALEALSKMAEYYHARLNQSRKAFGYLAARGIDAKTADEFVLGYSDPAQNSSLNDFLRDTGIPKDTFLSTGIIRVRDGKTYDMFGGRIIIPIFDVSRRVIGFGGRSIEKEGLPKYINSPESAIFSKRLSLFGLDKTRKYITEMNEAFVVEGYFDLITLYGHGFKNVVSTLGTAVTEGQLLKLRNYTDNITMMLDGDEAGTKSALKLISTLADMDINGSMVVLPGGHDPDSFVRKEGMEGITRVIREKRPILDYFFEYSVRKYGLKSPHNKRAFIRSVMPHIGKIKDRISRRLYVKHLSELTQMEEQELLRELGGGVIQQLPPVITSVTAPSLIERQVLGALISNAGCRSFCRDESLLDLMKDGEFKELLAKVLECFERSSHIDLKRLIDELEDEGSRELVLSVSFEGGCADQSEAETILRDYFKHLEKGSIRDALRNITQRLSEAEKKGDGAAVNELLQQKQQIITRMKADFN
jgi:DNA primase